MYKNIIQRNVQSGKSVRKKKKGGIMTVGIVVVVIVVAVVIGVAVGMKQRNINNQLLSEGRMIKRDIDFMEKNYFYTSRIATYKQIYEKLDSSDLSGTGVSWSGKIGDIIFKSSLGWSARLAEVESDDENHKFNVTIPDKESNVSNLCCFVVDVV